MPCLLPQVKDPVRWRPSIGCIVALINRGSVPLTVFTLKQPGFNGPVAVRYLHHIADLDSVPVFHTLAAALERL